tara:strand:+ start:672 stop:1298 length:627 start_codon:yes stop_codon:yes gene_type:complete
MKKIILLISLFLSFSLISQEEQTFYNLSEEVSISSSPKNSYKSMEVKITNNLDEAINIHFPEGGIFLNDNKSAQDLVVLFYDKIVLSSGRSEKKVVYTACISPKKRAPRSSDKKWTYSYDQKLGDLIRYYHKNRVFVELATGKEHHDTFDKRQNFLQMSVWVYFDAEKNRIIDFATKYMFDGDKKAAEEFVDTFYPISKTFLDLYKRL